MKFILQRSTREQEILIFSLTTLFLFTQSSLCDSITLKVTPEAEKVSHTAKEFEILASLIPTDETGGKRAPLDLTIVVDTSGSMSGVPMTLTKQVLEFLTHELTAEDQVSIVRYSSGVETLIHPTKMNEEGKIQAQSRIRELYASGGTFLSGGLEAGAAITADMIQHERWSQNGEALPILILMSDGQANQGLTNSQEIMNQVYLTTGTPLDSPLPFALYTFGIGNNVDHNLMSTIAEQGNGAYFNVDSAYKIGESLSGMVGNLFNTVAKSVKLHLKVPSGMEDKIQIKRVDTMYSVQKLTDSHYEVFLGDIQVLSRRDTLITLELGAEDLKDKESMEQSIIDVWWEGYDLLEDRDNHKASPVTVIIKREFLELTEEEEKERRAKAPQEILLQHQRLSVARAIDDAYKASSSGDIEKSKQILQEATNTTNDENLKQAIKNIQDDIKPQSFLVNRMEVGRQGYGGATGSAYETNTAKLVKENFNNFSH